MEKLMNAIRTLMENHVEETGEKLGDGDSIAGVYNDCIVIVKIVNDELKTEVILGKPDIFNESLFIS